MRALVFALVGLLTPLAAQRSTPSLTEIGAMERVFDQRVMRHSLDAPMEVLGLTRGLYMAGHGVVFSTEVNLVQTPGISPFRPKLSKEEIATIRALKLKRLPELRTLMREMVVSSAASLDRLPPEEYVALGVMLFYNAWEDSAGMPHMILMNAQKKALLEVATNRQPKSALDSIIRVREE